MSVTTAVVMGALSDSFVPFRSANRYTGPIGTFSFHGEVTGDSGGGTASVSFSCAHQIFGFHPLLVLKMADSHDNLASAEVVRFTVDFTGNERIGVEAHHTLMAGLAGDSNLNFNSLELERRQVMIEPRRTGGTVVIFTWGTNTDTKVYHARLWGLVYDLEAFSKRPGYPADFLG